MLLNYLKLSLRQLARNPFFAFVKVIGLAVGLSVFFILWQYTQSELHSDQQWKDSDRIHRFGLIGKWTDDKVNYNQEYYCSNIVSLSELIVPKYPEIIEMTRILNQNNFITGGDRSYVTDHGTDLFLSVQDG